MERVDGLRPVAPEALHVTLCFLGSRPADELAAIADACALAARVAAPEVRLGETLWLPRRAPRVLAVGLDDLGGRLAAVQAGLSDALAAGGWYVPERRRYLPHVTVARVRARARVSAVELAPPEALAGRAELVTLYRSRLGGGGARYEALATVVLP